MSTASRDCCLLSVHAALFCQSQTEPLIFILHRSCQARSVTPRSLNDELRVESQVSPCELFGRKSGTETSYFRVLLPCQYHSTNATSSSRCQQQCYQKDQLSSLSMHFRLLRHVGYRRLSCCRVFRAYRTQGPRRL